MKLPDDPNLPPGSTNDPNAPWNDTSDIDCCHICGDGAEELEDPWGKVYAYQTCDKCGEPVCSRHYDYDVDHNGANYVDEVTCHECLKQDGREPV